VSAIASAADEGGTIGEAIAGMKVGDTRVIGGLLFRMEGEYKYRPEDNDDPHVPIMEKWFVSPRGVLVQVGPTDFRMEWTCKDCFERTQDPVAHIAFHQEQIDDRQDHS